MRNLLVFLKVSLNLGSNFFVVILFKDYSINNFVEYIYEELRNVINGFSVVNEIGVGGFVVVYYGEI